jgi:histidinol-phosphate phosphatase family protein
MILKKINIDKSWTLFLDRDGVINKKIENDYVKKWEDFEFMPGVIEAFKIFTSIFGRIIIVTNQQGIGKGLMSEKELSEIHKKMLSEIQKAGGKVDAIYFAPQIKESNHTDRKPNVGMALKAKKEFPEINFRKSVMAGDSKSDMEFGSKLGMIKILINQDNSIARKHPELVDFFFYDLNKFSTEL